ncbi:MAG: hypothetical protein M3R04_03385 [bacterium]|nr:hypothetical protein [bacterium]
MYNKVNDVNRVSDLDHDGFLKLDVAFSKHDDTQETEAVSYRPDDGEVVAAPESAFGALGVQDAATYGSLCSEIATQYKNKYPNG